MVVGIAELVCGTVALSTLTRSGDASEVAAGFRAVST